MAEATTNLGRVSLVPRGEYSATAVYNRLDLVQYSGSGYLVLKDGLTGVTPENGADYMLIAEKGDTGSTGPQGQPGTPGTDGADGAPGATGATGNGIASVVLTSGNHAAGTNDTYTITMTDGTSSTFTVYNGADGTSFVILGRYDTLDALTAAHPTGAEGDAWAVGERRGQ